METHENLLFEILKRNPSPDTLLILLRKLKEKGKLRMVIQECNKALDMHPNELRLRQLLSECYIETEQIDEAELQLKTMTTLLRDFIPSFKFLAEILARQGRGKEAINYLQIYSAHCPDDYEASQLLDSLKSPIEVFEREIQSAPIIPPEPDPELDREKAEVSNNEIDSARAKKEKMIGILESWREKIVEKRLSDTTLSE